MVCEKRGELLAVIQSSLPAGSLFSAREGRSCGPGGRSLSHQLFLSLLSRKLRWLFGHAPPFFPTFTRPRLFPARNVVYPEQTIFSPLSSDNPKPVGGT